MIKLCCTNSNSAKVSKVVLQKAFHQPSNVVDKPLKGENRHLIMLRYIYVRHSTKSHLLLCHTYIGNILR